MKPIYRRILAGIIAVITSLVAVASTLPPEATLTAIPLQSWLIAILSGLTGVYTPKPDAVIENEAPPTVVHHTEE